MGLRRLLAGKPPEKAMEHIETFSKAGLRTLIIGAKALAGPEYEAWAQRYRSAELSLYNRAEKLASVAARSAIR